MKKLLIAGSALFIAMSSITPVFAQTVTPKHPLRNDIKNIRQDVKEDRKEIRNDVMEGKKDLVKTIKDKIATEEGKIKQFISSRAVLAQAKITAISGSTLTVTQDGKTYTVNTGTFDKCTTQFRRRFWGSSSISEFSNGDTLNIFGLWTDDTKVAVNACSIRNTSIQKRFGVFIGNVISINSNGFTMSTKSGNRANQTVTVSSSTKMVNRKGDTMAITDLQIGNLVRVQGMWDNQINTVTEVKEVKDFTLPIIPTPTPKS